VLASLLEVVHDRGERGAISLAISGRQSSDRVGGTPKRPRPTAHRLARAHGVTVFAADHASSFDSSMVTAGLAVVVGSQATHFHTALGVAAVGAGAPPAHGYTGRWGTPKSRRSSRAVPMPMMTPMPAMRTSRRHRRLPGLRGSEGRNATV
jgi:hypothetical protein